MDHDALESRIDALYQLAPGEFVAQRNALAKELAGGGDKDAGKRVKKLAKATVTAWAVNRIVVAHSKAYENALEAGRAVRAALAGEGSVQEAMSERRAAVDTLTSAAVKELESLGGSAGPDAARRIGRTIEALVTAPPEDAVPGRLTHDLDPPGFEAVMGMALAAPPARPRRKPTAKPTRKVRSGKATANAASGSKPPPREGTRTQPRGGAKKRPSRKPKPKRAARDTPAPEQPPPEVDKARRAELRAARSAALKRVREARAGLEATERRVQAAQRAVERTGRAEAAARAELDRASAASADARKKLEEAEARAAQSQVLVDEAQRAVAELDEAGTT